MNPSKPNNNTAVHRVAGRADQLPCTLCCAGFAALTFLIQTASAVAACGIIVPANGSLTIAGSVTTNCVIVGDEANIFIVNSGMLTLTGEDPNSIIDGWIKLQGSQARLAFTTNNHNLLTSDPNDPGAIVGSYDTSAIQISTDNLEVMNKIAVTGALQIQAGSGTFRNDGLVWANRNNGAGAQKLVCCSGTFTGTGTYKISASGSTLLFSSSITDATDLDADFEIMAGTLDIDTDVTTSGDYDQTGGTVDVNVCTTFRAKQQ